MRKTTIILALCLSAFSLMSCAQNKKNEVPVKKDVNSKKLVVYFSRTGENYGVGYIKKGNTNIVAEIIANETKGHLFQIEPTKPYPEKYEDCVSQATKERRSQARPEIRHDIDIEPYDVIFLGYPIWWGDMPMPVYTFLEKHDWNGKTIIPFCTHEGSGISGTEQNIRKACKGAIVKAGFSVEGHEAQNHQEQVRKSVAEWIETLDLH